MDFQNMGGLEYLDTIQNNSIDLVLTDPPYIISKDSGMNTKYNMIKSNEENGIFSIKTETDWELYKSENGIVDDKKKLKYIQYGTIYGRKYSTRTQYGEWDTNFSMDMLDSIVCEYYKKLRYGGTIIIWFDLWKISELKIILEKYKFKQIRMIEWIKNNPQPINSKINYLSNCREIALVGVKGSNPTFNSKYDNGIYKYPVQSGKYRCHPTQKNIRLFEDLIRKHSNEHDTVLDTFLGGGTTAFACNNTNRLFKGYEKSQEYYENVLKLL